MNDRLRGEPLACATVVASRRRWATSAFLCVFTLSRALELAYAADALIEPVALPPVVVTGSRLPVAAETVSEFPIVITAREVRARASVTDLLREIAQAYVDQPGAPAGFASIYLRGADPNHTVVLIDGVKANDITSPRGGGFDLSLIDPAIVERVEILPGASSAVYGADAMAGVMNIVTGPPRGTGFRIAAGAGGRGYRSAHAAASLERGAVGLSADAASLDDGHRSDDAFKRLETGALRVRFGEETSRFVAASVRVIDQRSAAFPEDSGGPRLALIRAREQRDAEARLASLQAGAATGWGALKLYANDYDQDTDTRSPGVAPGVRDPFGLPRSSSHAQYRRWAVGAQSLIGAGAQAPALIGLEYQKESGDLASTLDFGFLSIPAKFALERRTRSAYGEARARPHARVQAQAGARVDDVERHGTQTSFQVGLRYLWPEIGSIATASYGTGFKPPSFFALGHPIVGNPQLRAEESRTIELALGSNEARTRYAWRAAVFGSRFTGLVDFDPGPPPRMVNRSHVAIEGAEAMMTVEPAARLRLRSGVTWLSYELPAGEGPLRNRPRLKATAAAAWEIRPGISANLRAAWIGRTFDSSIPTGTVELGSYLLMDTTLTFVRRGARITLALDNILDRKYQQFVGFPAPGRRVRLGATFDL